MSTLSYTLSRPETVVSDSQRASHTSTTSATTTRVMEMMKSLYQADQQAKFLNLQAEVDSLLEQLQTIKQQRQATAEQTTTDHNVGEKRH